MERERNEGLTRPMCEDNSTDGEASVEGGLRRRKKKMDVGLMKKKGI